MTALRTCDPVAVRFRAALRTALRLVFDFEDCVSAEQLPAVSVGSDDFCVLLFESSVDARVAAYRVFCPQQRPLDLSHLSAPQALHIVRSRWAVVSFVEFELLFGPPSINSVTLTSVFRHPDPLPCSTYREFHRRRWLQLTSAARSIRR